MNALKNIINHDYKLTNPDDSIRKRDINPYVNSAPRPTAYHAKRKNKNEDKEKDDEIIKNLPSHHLLKEAIDRKMLRLLEQNLINERFVMSYQLKQWGLTVERETKSSISVPHPSIKKNMRLKGFVYEQNFDGMKAPPQIKDIPQNHFEQTVSR